MQLSLRDDRAREAAHLKLTSRVRPHLLVPAASFKFMSADADMLESEQQWKAEIEGLGATALQDMAEMTARQREERDFFVAVRDAAVGSPPPLTRIG